MTNQTEKTTNTPDIESLSAAVTELQGRDKKIRADLTALEKQHKDLQAENQAAVDAGAEKERLRIVGLIGKNRQAYQTRLQELADIRSQAGESAKAATTASRQLCEQADELEAQIDKLKEQKAEILGSIGLVGIYRNQLNDLHSPRDMTRVNPRICV